MNSSLIFQHKIDSVIHLAAMKAVGESMQFPMMYYKNNLIGMINLLEVYTDPNCNNFSSINFFRLFLGHGEIRLLYIGIFELLHSLRWTRVFTHYWRKGNRTTSYECVWKNEVFHWRNAQGCVSFQRGKIKSLSASFSVSQSINSSYRNGI